MLLEGLFLPLSTPFYSDGRLYLRKVEHNAQRYSMTPASGLAVLTPDGEHERLSDEERREVLRSVAEAALPESLLLADVSRPGVAEALRLLEFAAELKYDAGLLRLESAGGSEQLQRSYAQAVADRSPLPLVLVADTDRPDTGTLVARLAQLPQVLGCVSVGKQAGNVARLLEETKEIAREVTVTPTFSAVSRRVLEKKETGAGGNYVALETLTGGARTAVVAPPVPAVKTRTKRVGFQVLAGRTLSCLDLLRAGAQGALLPFAVCAPQACYEVLAAWKDGDQALAAEKAERVCRAAAVIEEQLGAAGLKAACDLNGYYGGRPRLPGLPLRADELREVEQLMRGMRS